MANDDLIFRVQRLYAAIGAVEEADISKFMPKVINDGHRIGFNQDWSGGFSEAELANFAHSLIHNIASLEGHIKKWATQNGQDKAKVDDAFNSSLALKIIKDLWNIEKHPYPPRDGGHSGKSPRADKIEGQLQLTTRAEKGSFVGLTFTPQGVPKILGDGTAKVIISGDILDKDNNNIGGLHSTALEAVKVWESVLSDFGVKL